MLEAQGENKWMLEARVEGGKTQDSASENIANQKKRRGHMTHRNCVAHATKNYRCLPLRLLRHGIRVAERQSYLEI